MPKPMARTRAFLAEIQNPLPRGGIYRKRELDVDTMGIRSKYSPNILNRVKARSGAAFREREGRRNFALAYDLVVGIECTTPSPVEENPLKVVGPKAPLRCTITPRNISPRNEAQHVTLVAN